MTLKPSPVPVHTPVALALAGALLLTAPLLAQASGSSPAQEQSGAHLLTGQNAFTDYTKEHPGVTRKITAADLPKPYATESVDNGPRLVPRPQNVWPQAPPGFKVTLYANDLSDPRFIYTAPNGDLFVVESEPNHDSDNGTIKVYRGVGPDGKPQKEETFATGLRQPFGVAFYPLGSNPQWVYVGDTDSVVKFPYRNGDMKARGPRQTVVAQIPGGGRLRGGGHWTRDVVFSKDGSRMFVSVGSRSNDDDTDNNPAEFHRADVLEFTPEGKFVKVYAYGIRNCVGEAINPTTGQLWCSTNERDQLGNNLVPDYITHIQEGGFYGWPWYYMGGAKGGIQDPRQKGKHPELQGKVITPDVLLQPHNASLEMTFYEASQFPAEYKGDAFAAEHGSWNKAKRAGYEVIAVPMKDGHATGAYEDFVTGFVLPNGDVWGRPVGVAVAQDGSLFFSDDGSNSVWRVAYTGHSAGASAHSGH
jgi:glucose/arabinose dehydrogenase